MKEANYEMKANYTDNEGGQLYGHGSIGIWKVTNYTDMEGGQLNGYGMEGGQLYGYGRWPTIRMWKVAN